VGRLTKDFEPFKNLWITAADWQKWYETWMNDSLINIDPDVLINNVNNAYKSMHKSVKHFRHVYINPFITELLEYDNTVINSTVVSLRLYCQK